MQFILLVRDYLDWHYGTAFSDIFFVFRNYLWFILHLFSVPEVLRSLFSPFKRLEEKKVNIIRSPETYFSNLVVNIIMRIVGLLIRSALLALALIAFTVVFVVGIFTFVVWTILPGIVIFLFISGLHSFTT